jgi:chemotaxis regulatin CheY-phosphate phosphatase CheZ
MGEKAMTEEEALADLDKVNERLRELERILRNALRDHPASRAAPLLQQEIADAMARKDWLFEQIQRMEKAG